MQINTAQQIVAWISRRFPGSVAVVEIPPSEAQGIPFPEAIESPLGAETSQITGLPTLEIWLQNLLQPPEGLLASGNCLQVPGQDANAPASPPMQGLTCQASTWVSNAYQNCVNNDWSTPSKQAYAAAALRAAKAFQAVGQNSNYERLAVDTATDAGWNPSAASPQNRQAMLKAAIYTYNDPNPGNPSEKPRALALIDQITGVMVSDAYQNCTNNGWSPASKTAYAATALQAAKAFQAIGQDSNYERLAVDTATDASWNPSTASPQNRQAMLKAATYTYNDPNPGNPSEKSRALALIDQITGVMVSDAYQNCTNNGWSPASKTAYAATALQAAKAFQAIGQNSNYERLAVDTATDASWNPSTASPQNRQAMLAAATYTYENPNPQNPSEQARAHALIEALNSSDLEAQ